MILCFMLKKYLTTKSWNFSVALIEPKSIKNYKNRYRQSQKNAFQKNRGIIFYFGRMQKWKQKKLTNFHCFFCKCTFLCLNFIEHINLIDLCFCFAFFLFITINNKSIGYPRISPELISLGINILFKAANW